MKIKLLYLLTILAVAAAAPSHSRLRQSRNTKEKEPPHSSLQDHPIDPDVKKVFDILQDTAWQKDIKYVASGNRTCESPYGEWVNDKIEEMGLDVHTWLAEKGAFSMPCDYKFLFDRGEHNEYIGINGAETEELFERHKTARIFWESVDTEGNLDTHNVRLLGAHGKLLRNQLAIATLLHLYGENPLMIPFMVPKIQNYIETNVPGSYDNPLFTMCAKGTPDFTIFGLEMYPAAITMGDGFIEFLKDVGFGRDGPDLILAHEWGHHMQHDIMPGMINDILFPSDPETTRRYELMADALAGYFMAHGKGGNLSEEHVQELHEAFFVLGDCDVTGNDHHGTPIQRECAAMWGAAQAASDSGEDKIMHPSTFRDAFDTALDDIIAVDKSVCKTVLSRL